MKISRVGMDLAKQVFEVCGVDRRGKVRLRKTLRRARVLEFFAQLEPCVVGIEACGSAHYWARKLTGIGHEVKLIAPQFVRPYRKNEKNDANDAEAICEAVSRPSMRFVAIKSEEQQAVLTLHRARHLLVGERTALVNQIRGLLAEYGIIVAPGVAKVRRALPDIIEDAEQSLPGLARQTFAEMNDRLADLDRRSLAYDRRIELLAHEMPAAQRLMQLEGIGPVTATALIATVGNARVFDNGRQFAAWLGLVPRQYSTGGKPRLGRITKRGDTYLRTLLIHGARSAMRTLGRRTDAKSRWAQELKVRRGYNKTAVALAARNARILWAMLAHDEDYRPAATVTN
ncbi:MAG: IS110 family transposase [Candidatus Binatia bacterium]